MKVLGVTFQRFTIVEKIRETISGLITKCLIWGEHSNVSKEIKLSNIDTFVSMIIGLNRIISQILNYFYIQTHWKWFIIISCGIAILPT